MHKAGSKEKSVRVTLQHNKSPGTEINNLPVLGLCRFSIFTTIQPRQEILTQVKYLNNANTPSYIVDRYINIYSITRL